MLTMTDSADGFCCPHPHALFLFYPYNQAFAPSSSARFYLAY